MSTLALGTVGRRPRLGDITGTAPRAAFGQIVRNEVRLALRRPIGLIGGVGLPVALLVIFGEVPAFKQVLPSFGGGDIFDAYVPVLMCFGLAMLALLGLAVSFLLATAGLFAIGLLIAAVARTSAAVNVIGRVKTGFPPAVPLLVLAAYAVVFGYLARHFFRWE